MDSYSVIIKPHVTEKTMNLIDLNNEIAFVVNRKANKRQIKFAFEDLYEEKVARVNTHIQRRGRGTPAHRVASHRFKDKIRYRSYDALEKEGSIKGKVIDIVHDPARTAPIAEVKFENGEKKFILAPESIQVDDEIECGISAPIKFGNTLPLAEIPEGTPIYDIENTPGDGGRFVRSSGTYANVVTHDANQTVVELPSGELKYLNPNCRASIGVVAGGGRKDKPFLKAGKKWHAYKAKGKKFMTVRGVAVQLQLKEQV